VRISVASTAVLFVFCVTPLEISGGPVLSGPYANRLSKADIVQIKTLVSKETGIDHKLKKIEAVRPDKVRIRTGGRSAVDSATYNDFNVYKRAGRWVIDTASIEISVETIIQPNNGQILIR
jgi:hypothetical protein